MTTMDERIIRLLDKAEAALDRGEDDIAEGFRILAVQTSYLRKQAAKELDRAYEREQVKEDTR